MAFDALAGRISGAFKKLRSRGRLTENDVKEAMREIKMALLDADVNYKIVKDFVKDVTELASGCEVLESLSPAQQVIKVVNERLTDLMGGQGAKINTSNNPPTIIMMVGLQGAGKTTNIAKLAGMLKKQQAKRPLLVACDVYRPAAIKQLSVVGGALSVPVFEMGQLDPVKIACEAIAHAKKHGNDFVFLDTAGRLHIDDELMRELVDIRDRVHPHEIMLVVDAMTGQDAVNVAKTFDELLGIDSIFMTKLDGDSRGGAALSVKAVTGKPIKFVGTGEKLDNIEQFHPDRMASRILGMGDMLTLIEKTQENFDEKKALELANRAKKAQLTLNDLYEQMLQIKKMGSVQDILGMIPGMDSKSLSGISLDGKLLSHTEAIILSMTPKERENPSIINFSRKKRIASGCGLTVQEINRLLKQFEMMQKMTKQVSAMGGKAKRKKGGNMGFPPGIKFPF